MPIDPEATAAGHKYVMGNVNAYCPKCSEEESRRVGRPVTVLTCDHDTDDEEDPAVTAAGTLSQSALLDAATEAIRLQDPI